MKGSKNYPRSAVPEHEKILQHGKSKKLQEKECCEQSGLFHKKSVK